MKIKKLVKRILPKFLLNLLINIYNTINKKIFYILINISPKIAIKFRYKINTKKKLNLKHPKDLNEKLQWLNLYWQHPLKIKCTDKYQVRDYIKNCGCEEILNQLYNIYNDASEINWEDLPNEFVLKTTNSCGTNIICDNKNNLNKDSTLKKLDEWLKIDYGKKYGELHYSKIKPRIICEKYLKTKKMELLNDYKVYCFNGYAKFLVFHSERNINHKRVALDLNWHKLKIINDWFTEAPTPPKPKSLQKIIDYSEKLANNLPFVRIDFYILKEKIIFGEMTFSPAGGIQDIFTTEAKKIMGSWIELPKKYIN
ncbi:MAG: hypothetical protein K9M44_02210 [Candidatus Pacebacteria bacterium]|nr:hypothetical protein [Candidatus Paceibacterota bacterium]